MRFLRHATMWSCAMLAPLTVSAAPLPEVQVDYSADSTMETEGGMTMKSRIYPYGQQGSDGDGWVGRNDDDHPEG